jgi:hypothetical protein
MGPPVNRPAGILLRGPRDSSRWRSSCRWRKMMGPSTRQRILSPGGFAAIAIAILTSAPACAQQRVALCHGRSVNVEHGNRREVIEVDAAGGSLCLYRGPATVHLEVRQTSIAAILSALGGDYKISYRSSVPLTEMRSGKYTGRVQTVIADLLDGYDYAIKSENSNVEVIVFNKSGGQAVPAPPASAPLTAPVAFEAEQAAADTKEAKKTRGEVTVSRSH